MKMYRTEDSSEIERILASNTLGQPKTLRLKGNAVEKDGKWDFDLKTIITCANGEYKEDWYLHIQEKSRQAAIDNMMTFVKSLQKSGKIFKKGLVDMNTGKIVDID